MANEKKRIEEIYHLALEKKNKKDRSAYLDSACGDDSKLRAAVEGLLQAHDKAGNFLEVPPFDPDVTLDTSPLTEGPGTTIGNYKLLEQIGEGGMAVVYMAEQEKPIRRRVALKIIKLGMDTKQVIARFEAERQALAVLDHPNIAKVLDAGSTETGRPYFVMELVRGVSISKYCDKNKLDTKERLDLFIQVCNAVQHAHQKGIIHRDIKPYNVMVTLRDGKPVPKVIDFGIAKATSQRLTEKTLFTRYAQMIGTPAYMSPEQAEFSELDIDTRTDIYSLGVLLYELLTGTTPFSEEQLREAGYLEMQRIIREEEPLKPSTKLSTLGDTLTDVAEHRKASPDLLQKLVRGDLDWIAMKSLEKDRTRRYDTATELSADIARHLNHEPVLAAAPSVSYRMRKYIRRHRVGVMASSLVALALVVGLCVATVGFAQASIEKTRTQAALVRAGVNFRLARNAVDEMTDVAQKKLADNPQMKQLHQEFLQKAVIFYQAFLKENSDDPAIRDEIGRAFRRLGGIHKMLGQHKQAEQALRSSIGVFKKLSSEFPNAGEHRMEVVVSQSEFISVLQDLFRRQEAERACFEAMAIGEKLVVEFPDVPAFKSALAQVLVKRGIILRRLYRPKEAEPLLRKAVRLNEQAAADLPDDVQHQTILADSYFELVRALHGRGQLEEVEDPARKGLAIRRRLVKDYPSETDYQSQLAEGLIWLSKILKKPSQLSEEEQVMREAGQIFEKLVTDFPDLPSYRWGLARSHMNLGHVLKAANRLAEAEQEYRQGVTLQEKLILEFPTVYEYWQPMSQNHYHLRSLLSKTGQKKEAEEVSQRELDFTDKLIDNFPSVRFPEWLAICRDQHAWHLATCVNPKHRNPARAFELAEHAIVSRLAIMNNLAVVNMNQGRYNKAKSILTRTLQLDRRLLAQSHASTLICEQNLDLANAGTPKDGQKIKLNIPSENLDLPEGMHGCAQNLHKIHTAIQEYKKNKGALPNWLSDLVPDYLNGDTLLCPVDPSHYGRWYPDPKLASSYGYQFSTIKHAPPQDKYSVREVKTKQAEVFGDVVPIVRCYCHGTDTLNLAVGGQIYWSNQHWERMFHAYYQFERFELGWLLDAAQKPWPKLPARFPRPADGAPFDVTPDIELRWAPILDAIAYNVYFGTDPENLTLLGRVENATNLTSPTLERRSWYFWRVDAEKSDSSVTTGELWSFSTGDMIGWWKFDETNGETVIDSSGNGLHGKLVGDARITSDPTRGNVLSLDGDGDYVDCGNNWILNITDEITLAAWIKVIVFDRGWQAIVTKGDSAWRLSRKHLSDFLAFHCTGIRSSSEESWGPFSHLGVEGTVDVNDGKWHHVVAVYDGKKIFLYVDGVLDNVEQASGRIETNPFAVMIGDNAQNPARCWNGLIDDVRIYSYALTEAEVKEVYAGRGPGPNKKPE